MKISVTESHKRNDLLFQEGDSANQFFILLKGRVKLSLRETSHVVYAVSNAGEAFGWSSLINRDAYSALAECMSPTKLLKFEKEKLHAFLEKDTANGFLFFKRLAELLGNRLLNSYTMISSASLDEGSRSFGSGQIMMTVNEL